MLLAGGWNQSQQLDLTGPAAAMKMKVRVKVKMKMKIKVKMAATLFMGTSLKQQATRSSMITPLTAAILAKLGLVGLAKAVRRVLLRVVAVLLIVLHWIIMLVTAPTDSQLVSKSSSCTGAAAATLTAVEAMLKPLRHSSSCNSLSCRGKQDIAVIKCNSESSRESSSSSGGGGSSPKGQVTGTRRGMTTISCSSRSASSLQKNLIISMNHFCLLSSDESQEEVLGSRWEQGSKQIVYRSSG
jgi:hypothetical protein